MSSINSKQITVKIFNNGDYIIEDMPEVTKTFSKKNGTAKLMKIWYEYFILYT